MSPETESRNGGVLREPSVSTALEHLVVASQGVITKRIDLALLEGQELVSRTLRNAMLGAVSLVLALAAWFALVACFIEWMAADQTLLLRLGMLGLINAAAAAALAIAIRSANQASANAGAAHTIGSPKPQLEGGAVRGGN